MARPPTSLTRPKLTARSQALALKTTSVLSQLGQQAFTEFGSRAGPPDIVQPIASSTARLEKLDEEVRELRDAAYWPLTPLNVMVAFVGAIVAAILYVAYLSFAHS